MTKVILLTGCINPNGMPFTTITNISVRMNQYLNAIDFYLQKTSFPIVFVENSGTDISNKIVDESNNNRLEVLSFNGNRDKTRGKGYGEAEIINFAFNNSNIIKSHLNNCIIIKITGRLIINNINDVINKRFILQNKKSIIASFYSNFSFADSRIIIAPIYFYYTVINNKEKINDFENIYFENILSKCIIQDHKYQYFPFYVEPLITGQSGTTGEEYLPNEINYKNRISYLRYAIWIILIFNKRFSKKKLNICKKFVYKTEYLVIRMLEKIMKYN